MKTASGISRLASASGAFPATISRPGVPRTIALWAIIVRRASRPVDGNGAGTTRRPHPLDPDRTAARADIPQQPAGHRSQPRQRHRPHLPLGQLPVMLETPRRAIPEPMAAAPHPGCATQEIASVLKSAKCRLVGGDPVSAHHGDIARPVRPCVRAPMHLGAAIAAVRSGSAPPRSTVCPEEVNAMIRAPG
jgi:hypothetical protein